MRRDHDTPADRPEQPHAASRARAHILRALEGWATDWPDAHKIEILYVTPQAHETPALIARTFPNARLTVTAPEEPTTEQIEIHAITMPEPNLTGLLGVNRYDYVIGDMALHGLPQIEVMTMLRAFDRLARAGLIWADRCQHASLLARLGMADRPLGFTKRAARDLADRVDLGWLRHASRSTQGVFVMSGQRRGAWSGPPPIVRA